MTLGRSRLAWPGPELTGRGSDCLPEFPDGDAPGQAARDVLGVEDLGNGDDHGCH